MRSSSKRRSPARAARGEARRIGLVSDGNNDQGGWAKRLSGAQTLKIGEVAICVVHEIADLKAKGCRVVVSGHSHKPKIEERCGVLYVNPGSAGPRRFTLPVAVGELRISGASVRAKIKELL